MITLHACTFHQIWWLITVSTQSKKRFPDLNVFESLSLKPHSIEAFVFQNVVHYQQLQYFLPRSLCGKYCRSYLKVNPPCFNVGENNITNQIPNVKHYKLKLFNYFYLLYHIKHFAIGGTAVAMVVYTVVDMVVDTVVDTNIIYSVPPCAE